MKINEEIETLFKVDAPLKELKNGFGYSGVILRNKTTDLIQCHICGKWFKALPSHVLKSHKLTSDEYKIEFQLPLLFPLCSLSTSASFSKNALKPENLERLKLNRKPHLARRKCGRKRIKFINRYMKNNDSFHNKVGICEEQLLQRYLIVCDEAEKTASGRDLKKYDQSCLAAIRRRYGTLNKFKIHHGMSIKIKPKSLPELEILSILRKVSKELGRIAPSTYFRTSRYGITSMTVRNRLGSWNRALSKAGLI